MLLHFAKAFIPQILHVVQLTIHLKNSNREQSERKSRNRKKTPSKRTFLQVWPGGLGHLRPKGSELKYKFQALSLPVELEPLLRRQKRIIEMHAFWKVTTCSGSNPGNWNLNSVQGHNSASDLLASARARLVTFNSLMKKSYFDYQPRIAGSPGN